MVKIKKKSIFSCILKGKLFLYSLLKALAHEIDLGDMAVYTSNVGIQVLYRCEYETALTVSSEAFDVQARVKH